MPVVLPEEEVKALMEAGEAEVDLEALEVRFDGRAVPFELDAERRHRLLNGLDDIALTLQKGEDDRGLRGRARASRSRHSQSVGSPNLCLISPSSPVTGSAPKWPPPPSKSSTPSPPTSRYDEHPAGGAAIDLHGTALTDEALAAVKASDAVLLGALGGPKWDTNEPGAVRPEQGLFKLRAELGLYANLRPVRPLRALYDASPLKRELIEGVDMLIVRELTGGLYYGERGTKDGRAFDTMVYTVAGDRADRPRRLRGRQAPRDVASTRPTCSTRAGCGARS